MEGPRPDTVPCARGNSHHILNSAILAILLLLTPLASHAGGSLYFVHNDRNGTPVALTDESGTKVWSAEHDPYGKATVDEDPDGDGVKVEFNLRFPGQYYDKETGLHYNHHRYYDPDTGRYLTSDPVGLEGGLNTYAYAGGNPIMRYDYFGLAEICNIGLPVSLGIPHTFLCANGKCGGKHGGNAGSSLYTPYSRVKDDSGDRSNALCSDVPEFNCDPISFNECIQNKLEPKILNEPYFFAGKNCGSWAIETIAECRNACTKNQQ